MNRSVSRLVGSLRAAGRFWLDEKTVHCSETFVNSETGGILRLIGLDVDAFLLPSYKDSSCELPESSAIFIIEETTKEH